MSLSPDALTDVLTDALTTIPANPPANAPIDAPLHWQSFPAAAIADLSDAWVVWSERMPGGAHWSWRLKRGTALRFVALEAGANASVVLYSAEEKLERYNLPDSLKAQHTAHYTRGHVLMTDMGRAIASVTADSVGWHDPLGGLLDAASMAAKYGEHRFGEYRNAMYRSGQDGLLIEIGKYGLTKRDLIAPVNLFSKVNVDAEGRFNFATDHTQAGDFVELRLDMDAIVAVSTAPHPLDPNPVYAPKRVGVIGWHCGPAPADDYCRSFRGEGARALYNTDLYYA